MVVDSDMMGGMKGGYHRDAGRKKLGGTGTRPLLYKFLISHAGFNATVLGCKWSVSGGVVRIRIASAARFDDQSSPR